MSGVQVVRLPGRAAVRAGSASVVVRPRAAAVTGAVLLLTLLLGCVAVSVGEYVVPLPDVGRAVLGQGDPGQVLVVQTFRLPRVLAGALVGAALGASGAVTASVVRNPLATPDVIGRIVARPSELDVGIVTALVGAPFLIAIVRRQKVREL